MSKNEKQTRLRISEKEVQGFQNFRDWVNQVNLTTTSISSTPYGYHFDADMFLQGCRHHRVEIKYMPTKVYDNYDYVTLNFEKPLQLPSAGPEKGCPADMYYIQYADNVVVTTSRDNIDRFIKDYGLCAFQVHTVNKTEMDPSNGTEDQIQLAIPHKEAGNYYKLYKGTTRVK